MLEDAHGGGNHPYDIYLIGDDFIFSYAELILPDSGRIRYNRTSPGTGYVDAVMEHTLLRLLSISRRLDGLIRVSTWAGR